MTRPPKKLCKHGNVVCKRCAVITDAGKRMADRINLMVISHPWDTIVHSWMAFRLDTGDSDGVLYDTRQDALTHQLDERFCLYFYMRNAMGGADPLDCSLAIAMHRDIYDNGGRWTEPATPQLIMSTRGYDVMTGRVNPYEDSNRPDKAP